MPLTDLVRYFNTADQTGDSMLYHEGARIAGWHAGLRLGSLFQPIVDLRSASIVGHYATLAVRREDGTPVRSEEAYERCESASEIIHFDRLCRTLHALNFLAQRQFAGGYLQVPIHHRHLLAVPNQHGLVYEAILKRCGLAPEDIVLEVNAARFDESPALVQALLSYRERGYRLALTGVAQDSDLATLASLQPATLKLPGSESAALCRRAQAAGMSLQAADITNEQAYAAARVSGFTLGIGELFGAAQADCHRTHSQHRLAYNPASNPGARL